MSKNIKNLIVLSSPSGGGKTTVARHIFEKFPIFNFSISATTRKIRAGETNGKDYYFLNREEFENKIKNDEFIEYEEIFGNLYGTLKSEIHKSINNNKLILFDIDVKGAKSLKNTFPENTILIFISPPNSEELEKRLRLRSTETEEQLKRRIERTKLEMEYSKYFDYIIINDKLETTFNLIDKIIQKILE